MWTSDEIAKAATGTAQGAAFEAGSVVIDSRKIVPGALFVALSGKRVDGHEYVKEVLAKGAAGALVHRKPEGLAENAPIVVVNDTYKALVDMAMFSRKCTSAKILAVTGSVGKTGTKEALRIALASAGSVYATQGNLNNHIGLPLSLANLPRDAKFGVFELGMNHAGELSFLTRIARPDIAVITNVEAVHLEFFAGLEGIADAKAEIMEGVPKEGTIVLNRDNRFYEHLLARAQSQGITRVVTFGAHEETDCRLIKYFLQDLGTQVEAVVNGMAITYRLGTIGRHWALTSLAALACATSAGADLADAAAALAYFHEPDGRGRMQRVPLRQGAVMLIDDSYNASPTSVLAALARLAELHAGLGGKGRKIVVLGDMLELGKEAAGLHAALAPALLEHHIDALYTAGPLMKHLHEATPSAKRGAHAANATALAPVVQEALRAGDFVLIKGSHGSRMDIVRDALLNATPQAKEREDAL